MKKLLLLSVVLFTISCKENQPKIEFKKFNEETELQQQQKHKHPRMKFKLMQSKVLDMNTVFAEVQKELTDFSEEEYQQLKPLIIEQNIPTIQKAVIDGKLTYEKLTKFYLYRIRKFESDSTKYLNAIIAFNPNVVKEARQRDKNRPENVENTLYGMPILLKDNINTKGMPTTAGAIALQNNIDTEDAFIVKKLKENGALILGKANLSEWAYYFCSGCPVGYSAIGGQSLNPYGRKVFETGGSSASSGTATAANYAVAAVGTETAGSITSPSSQNSLVGLKPTIGFYSRTGIVPISSTLDTPGPMTKFVIDNLIFAKAMLGKDEKDNTSVAINLEDFNMNKNQSLKGKKFGVFENLLQDSIYKSTVDKIKNAGAEIVKISPKPMNYSGFLTLLNIDMKHDLPNYLANDADKKVSIRSVNDVVLFNKKDSLVRAPYGQQLFEGIVADTTSNQSFQKIKTDLHKNGKQFFNAFEVYNLDAILSINNYHSAVSAVAKYPNLSVPMGYKKSGEPVSITFIGTPFTEAKLYKLALAFEVLTKVRKSPY